LVFSTGLGVRVLIAAGSILTVGSVGARGGVRFGAVTCVPNCCLYKVGTRTMAAFDFLAIVQLVSNTSVLKYKLFKKLAFKKVYILK
jgi:hypothetical protein